jgi:hypothetical protein
VRNVLLNTFELVEGVVTDSSQIARALSQAALPAPPDGDADSAASVIGWQEVVLNKNGICEECNAILPLGERAAIGLPTGARAILLCMSCLGFRTPPVAVPVKSKVPRKKKKVPAPKSAADPKKTTR